MCFLVYAILTAGSVVFASEQSPLLRFVLDGSDVPGFTVTREPRLYGPESLWNYINGGATPYLDYGVTEVITYGGIIRPDSLAVIIDVYDMADSLGAFGIYSNERFPEYVYLVIGAEGYMSENALCFWQGRYYVKVFTEDYDPPSIEPLKRIAQKLSARIGDTSAMPEVFSVFPMNGRVEHTESYAAKNVLGQEYLNRAYSVAYNDGDVEYRLYIIDGESPERVNDMFDTYRAFLNEYGTMTTDTVATGEESFVALEDWYGTIACVRTGPWMYMSVGLEDLKRVGDVLRSLHEALVSKDQ